MKKSLVLGLAIGFVTLAATASFAGPSADMGVITHTPIAGDKNIGGTGIVGTSHDLSNVGNMIGSQAAGAFSALADNQQRICVYCHHPHNAFAATGNLGSRDGATAGTLEYSPLWNRNMSTTTFTGYDNGVMMGAGSVNGTDKRHALNAHDAGGGTGLGGVSLLCMSCHDGVVAMNAYSQTTGSSLNGGEIATGGAITSTAVFKGDMNNHHPMGFDYVAVQAADAEIAATSVKMTGNTSIGDLLYNGNQMECVTCHDVHNTANQAGAERFLWRTNDKSNFCLTCHLK